MDEVTLAVQEAVHTVREIAPDLIHPEPISLGCYASDLHPARRQLDEEQHEVALQSPVCPYFDSEKVGRHDQALRA